MTCYSRRGKDREQNACESIDDDDDDARTEREAKGEQGKSTREEEITSTLARLIDYDIALSYTNVLMSVTCHQTSMMMMMIIEEVEETE